MTDDGTTDDGSIADLYANDPVPDHGPDFWQDLSTGLTGRVGADDVVADVIELQQLAPVEAANQDQPRRRWPLLMSAAAGIALIGLGAIFVGARSDGNDSSAVAIRAVDEGSVADPMNLTSDYQLRRASTPIFTVESESLDDRGLYWTVATLDQFDGSVWTSKGDFHPAPEPPDLDPESDRFVTHTFSLFDDSHPLLPHPGHWLAVESDPQLRANAQRDLARQDGTPTAPVTYIVHSDLLAKDVAMVPFDVGDPVGSPDDPVMVPVDSVRQQAWIDELLRLPDDFPDEVRDLALNLTAGIETDREKATVVQDFFRNEFSFSLDESSSSDADAMVAFLQRRSGGTQAFAGTYAAMMRSLGIPSRVKAGFVGGTPDPTNPQRLTVTGGHAHVWPEILLQSTGLGEWMRFDPTPGRGEPTATVRPVVNRDHWHAAYAVYDCTLGEGGGYLTPFLSEVDEVGIHSHQDGLIHIHPWFESSAGENAQLGHFFDSMGIEVDESAITLDTGEVLASGVTCDGQPAVVHVRKWQFDFDVGTAAADVIVSDLGAVRFENDREVYIIALAPLDAEIPVLPAERLATLNEHAGVVTGE